MIFFSFIVTHEVNGYREATVTLSFYLSPFLDNRVKKLLPQLLMYSYKSRPHLVGWLVVLGFNIPLRQYFSLYWVVSQREGERGEIG